MPSTILVHAQLEMTNPGDSDEQEADEMADSIVNGGKIARSVSTGHSGSGIALPSQFGSQLASLQGQGSRLYGGLKSQMESGFGRDFSDVRIHTGNAASEMSSSISAKAFTYGNDIYFNRGQYSPDTKDGRHLIAHELTHVMQGTGKVGREERNSNSNSSAYNRKKRKLEPVAKYSTEKSLILKSEDLPHRIKDDDDNYEMYVKMENQFIEISTATLEKAYNQEEMRVNVAVRMSMKADDDAGFICENYYGDLGKAENNLIVLQEMPSIQTCTNLLSLINSEIGPIQNLIISGHGESNSIRFDSDHKWIIDGDKKDTKDTRAFFKTVGKLMPENGTSKIVLDSCLTDTHKDGQSNITEFVKKTIPWKNEENKRNNIIGGKAYLDNDIKYYVDSKGVLSVKDEGPGKSRLSSDTQYYVGPGAREPEGHIRGIQDKFIKSKNVNELDADLSYYAGHIKWKKELSINDPMKLSAEYDFLSLKTTIDQFLSYNVDDVQKCLSDSLKGINTSCPDGMLDVISGPLSSLLCHDWRKLVEEISENDSADPIPWNLSREKRDQRISIIEPLVFADDE